MKRWLGRIALGLVGLVILLVLIGSTWERSQRSAAAEKYPPQGKLVDIGGRMMQIDCRGEGTPTVVLVHGLDTFGSLAWTAVHDSIAKTTRTCAYSRAGITWSDAGPDVTAKGVAEDLHATLEKAGEKAPFVLVGHSLGGPYIMTYTKYFGDQVAGLVMVDASHPDQLKRFASIAPAAASPSLTGMKIAAALGWTGLVRYETRNALTLMPHQDSAGVRAANAYVSTSLVGAMKEMTALGAILDEAGTIRSVGNRPLVVLTAMMPMTAAEKKALKVSDEKAKEFKDTWNAMHDDEASWSTRSQHIVLTDATHYVQFFRPDVVISATRSVVDSVRADAARAQNAAQAPNAGASATRQPLAATR